MKKPKHLSSEEYEQYVKPKEESSFFMKSPFPCVKTPSAVFEFHGNPLMEIGIGDNAGTLHIFIKGGDKPGEPSVNIIALSIRKLEDGNVELNDSYSRTTGYHWPVKLPEFTDTAPPEWKEEIERMCKQGEGTKHMQKVFVPWK